MVTKLVVDRHVFIVHSC